MEVRTRSGRREDARTRRGCGASGILYEPRSGNGGWSMTEAEWLVCEDAEAMLACPRLPASDRHLRLFLCTCCRLQWHLLDDGHSRQSIEDAERYADGLIGEDELQQAFVAASEATS